MQDLLRGPGGLRPLRVRPHVPLLPGGKLKIFGDTRENICMSLYSVRAAAVEGAGRGHLSDVPRADTGRDQDLQIIAAATSPNQPQDTRQCFCDILTYIKYLIINDMRYL